MFERDEARVIKVDFDRVRNTDRIAAGNQASFKMWQEEQKQRQLQTRQAELIRRQKQAAAFQRALDSYNKPTLRDWLTAPLRTVKAVWGLR